MMSIVVCVWVFFFFKQKTAYEMRISDWSSDVCSSDLQVGGGEDAFEFGAHLRLPAGVELLQAAQRRHHAGGALRVEPVEFAHPVGQAGVAAAVLRVEAHRFGPGECAAPRPHLVRRADRAGGMASGVL